MQHPKLMTLVYRSKSSRSGKIWWCSLYASFSFGDTCIDGPKVLPVKWNQHFFHLCNCQARLFPHSSLRKRLEKLCPCLATVFIPPPLPPSKTTTTKTKTKKISKHIFRPDLRPLLKHEHIVGFCVWDMFSNSRCCLCSVHEANRIFAPLILFLPSCLSH